MTTEPAGKTSLLVFRDLPGCQAAEAVSRLPADYALARFHVEEEAASSATSEAAQAIHHQLAHAYSQIALRRNC